MDPAGNPTARTGTCISEGSVPDAVEAEGLQVQSQGAQGQGRSRSGGESPAPAAVIKHDQESQTFEPHQSYSSEESDEDEVGLPVRRPNPSSIGNHRHYNQHQKHHNKHQQHQPSSTAATAARRPFYEYERGPEDPEDPQYYSHAYFWPPKMDELEPDQEESMVSTLTTTLAATPRRGKDISKRNPLEFCMRKTQSMLEIPLKAFEEPQVEEVIKKDHVDGIGFSPTHAIGSNISLTDLFGEEVTEDIFQKEVALKTQMYMVGQQEAETEVFIDRLIVKEGSLEKTLLFVVTQIQSEWKVQVFVNLLLNRGAHASFCDDNWQTPLHHAVRLGFKGVVTKLLEHDALPHCKDRNRKMPLHFAFEAKDDDIAAELLKNMPNHVVRDLFICHGTSLAECTMQELMERGMQQSALAVLDCMIDQVGSSGIARVYYNILEADEKGRPPTHADFQTHTRSCLHLISKGGYKDLVYHVVVRLLIRRKWKSFARLRFQVNSSLFLLTLFCLTFSVVVSVMSQDPAVYDSPLQYARAACECWWMVSASMTFFIELNQMRNPLQYARAACECWWMVSASMTFFIELNQMRKHKLEYWKDQFNWIDLSSSVLLILVCPLRFAHQQEQWAVFSVGYLLWTLRIFKYAAIFRQTGAYAQILWRIVSNDFLQFTVVFLVILLAFSGTFLLSLRGEDSLGIHPETSTFWNVLFTGVRILIEGQPVVDYTGDGGYKVMSSMIMVAFLFVCCVVLLNILIAQLSDTYQNVQKDAQRGLELNRAWIVARVELNSLFIGKGYRVSKYVEMEELANPANALEKWESPILTDIGKTVTELKESLASTKLNILTVKNRLSRQEYALSRIQQQLESLIEIHKPVSRKKSKSMKM